MLANTPMSRLARSAMETTGLIGPYYRWLERRAARQAAPSVDDGHPMPPRDLITVVSGTPNSVWFSESGQADAAKFLALAAKHGLKTCIGLDALDLGCGSGRTGGPLHTLGHTVVGVDVDLSSPDMRLVSEAVEREQHAKNALGRMRQVLLVRRLICCRFYIACHHIGAGAKKQAST